MAETSAERAQPSITGSDLDLQCTPCAEDGGTESANKYCPVCNEYLCVTCVKYHRKLTATRDHVLIERDDAKSSCEKKLKGKKVACCLHPSAEITSFCKTHDAVFCYLCAATEHRKCQDVSSIKEALSSQQIIDIKSLQQEVKLCLAGLGDTQQHKEECVGKVDEDKVRILRTIEESQQQLIEKVNQLFEKAYEELKLKSNQAKGKLSQDISLLKYMKSELINVDAIIVEIDGFDEEVKFIHLKRGQKIVSNAKQLNDDMSIQTAGTLHFTEDSPLAKQILGASSLFSIAYDENRVKEQRYEVATLQQVNVKQAEDTNSFFITDLCTTDDNKFVLADHDNKKLKVYDDQLRFQKSYKLIAGPLGVCRTVDDNVTVKLENNSIVLFNVKTGTETKTFPIRYGGFLGLAYCDNMLWISVPEGLDVYDVSGSFVKTVKKENDSHTFQQIQTTRENKLIVASYGNRAVCYDTKTGKFQNEFQNSKLQVVRGVCSAPDGTVFASGQNSNNILMFQQDGTCLGTLLAADKRIKQPVALLYDAQRHRLLVTSSNSNSIQVIEFK